MGLLHSLALGWGWLEACIAASDAWRPERHQPGQPAEVILKEGKSMRITGKGQVTIPMEIREKDGFDHSQSGGQEVKPHLTISPRIVRSVPADKITLLLQQDACHCGEFGLQ